MNTWFTIDHIDEDTHIISEYRHWEEAHSYLLNGTASSLLIDTGLGIENICEEVRKLTTNPIIAVATHIHWDHIGGHKYFPHFYAHEAEIPWLTGQFPLTMDQIKAYVTERCQLPENFRIDDYEFFQGVPEKILKDHDIIDLGNRTIEILHTPGHMCFYEKDRQYLYTGDLVYKDTLFAYYPSTDPEAYLKSMEKISLLPVKKVFPAHHDLDVQPSIINDIKNAFLQLKAEGKLHHGSGCFQYKDFAVWI